MNLMSSYQIKGLNLKNRVVLPPMCQYSVVKEDGVANQWHELHYTSRAVGGTGLIIIEMTNVEPNGRITDFCLGLWNDEQEAALKNIVEKCHQYGAKVAIQIAHAGRKATGKHNAPVSSSAIAFDAESITPRALETSEVKEMVEKFKDSVARAVRAGVDAIELHGAHGYLIHQFHSPVTNQREDEYGADRALFGSEIVRAAKSVMPEDMPLIMRVSAREYCEGGYDVDYAIDVMKSYKEAGVDMFHISSGGESPRGPKAYAGYQVPLARKVKEVLEVPVIAVGILDDPVLANYVIESGDADLVAIGRRMLKDPNWPLAAAETLGLSTEVPAQLAPGFRIK